MGILGALYSGVSGLSSNGTAMTVIGNNISNSNTIGFKSSRTLFSDLLSTQVSGSGGESQIGRGAGLSVVDNDFSQGTFENTDTNSDLAIEGPGFFMVNDPDTGTTNYTRAGSFRFDSTGQLVNPEGARVQGYYLDDNGNTVGDVTDIKVNTQTFSPAKATGKVTLSTNLNALSPSIPGGFDLGADPTESATTNASNTSNYASSIQAYDSLGNTHLLTTYFTKTGDNTWTYNTTVDGGDLNGGTAGDPTPVATGRLNFDSNGNLITDPTNPKVSDVPAVIPPGTLNWNNGADTQQKITLNLNTTQYSSGSVVVSQQQDGFATGTLVKLSIDNNGNVLGNYSNGAPQKLARIAMAKFTNDQGLTKEGNNLFGQSEASGPPVIGTVGSGVGNIFTNSLEQSNVDLAKEFVNMITTQRGYQANSKTITTTDQMLDTLINLKR